MRLGAVYPQIELGGDPAALRQVGLAIEAIGFDHMVMYDHPVGADHENRDPPLIGPYTWEHPFHDPLVAFAYLAGITHRLEFMTGVLLLPERQTVLAAKQAAEVDLFSNGRLRLGVGIGWNYVEYEALGQAFATRGARLTEQIPYMRRLWREPLVDFEGNFDRMPRGNILPRPNRQIPIYCGGLSEAAFKRAANLADGFIFGGLEVTDTLPHFKRLREVLAAAERPAAGFGVECLVMNGRYGGLSVTKAVDAARRWEDAGGTHASIVTMGLGFHTPEQHLDYLADVYSRLAISASNGQDRGDSKRI